MLRLVKYLKPYVWMIVATIFLLFVQANTDLALPDYMSKIVNNGIQQGGILNTAPDALRQSQMDRLTIFMSAEDKDRVLADYTLVDSTSPDFAKTVETYPQAQNEPVYVLNAVGAEEMDWLNPVLGKAMLVVSGLQTALENPEQAAAMAQGSGFDLTKIPPGTDIFAVLAKLPQAQTAGMMAALNEKFASLDDSMIAQSAARLTKEEYVALGVDVDWMQTRYILVTGLQMLLLSLLGVICAVAVGFFSARVAAAVSRDLRKDVFQKVSQFSGAEFDRFSTASLITRSTNDITQIQMVVIMMMRMVFYAPIMGVGGIIRAVGKDSSMWWIIAVAVLVLVSLVGTVFSISLPRFKIVQKLIDRLNLVVRENLSGMMVIRAFNMQSFEETRFDKANRDLTDNSLFINRIMVVMMPAMMLIMNGLSLLIIWVGSHQVAQSSMQVGDMMAFLQYSMQIVFSFLMLSFMFIILPRASVSAERIGEVLAVEPSIHDPQQPRRLAGPVKGLVEFRGVSFRYPGAEEDVLHDINFTAQPGQTTAIIGSTGSGKSTVVNLIPRFYDVTGGVILLDGVDIRDITQHDLREHVGYIPQKSSLFSGTIGSNLRYADENASDALVSQAAEIAQAAEFIASQPEGLETEIAQGGMNVSGGQKQRISIARALVKQSPVYIFDDSFSALDFKTDAALRKALREHMAETTLIVVTQRISTIRNAEQIIVLDEGRVVGQGRHEDLMKTCETYREIALSQLSMEELG